jgi:hypothetical protein
MSLLKALCLTMAVAAITCILDSMALATASDNAGDIDYSDNESSGSEDEWKSIPKLLMYLG